MTILYRGMRNVMQTLKYEFDIQKYRAEARTNKADLSIFHDFVPPPIGGGHQFLRALWHEAESIGYVVENNTLSHTTLACLINSFNFDVNRLTRLHKKSVLTVHRVDGPIDVYRGIDAGVDKNICQINRLYADKTIFQSKYSFEKHYEMGLKFVNPVIIPNAADPEIFHPFGRNNFSTNRKIKLIASSWSDNYNKGAIDYKWLDEHLDWDKFEFTFVGRTPIKYQNIQVIPPVDSYQMAEYFRQHDIYVTASKNDPCSNSLIEALTCGMPAIFLKSGGHPEIVHEAGFGYEHVEEIPSMLDRLVNEYENYQKKITISSLSDVCKKYFTTLELI